MLKIYNMKNIVVIDNYDSFTYNLVHYLEDLNCNVTVYRNDEFDLEELESFDKILLSPGPGIPDEAGLLKPVIKKYYKTKSILGVCLGQQAIGEVFGGQLENLEKVYHGLATPMQILDSTEILFQNMQANQTIGRYHSWVVSSTNFPEELQITAVDDNQQIMALKHKYYDVRGVQFHPESVLTPNGKLMLQNWVNA